MLTVSRVQPPELDRTVVACPVAYPQASEPLVSVYSTVRYTAPGFQRTQVLLYVRAAAAAAARRSTEQPKQVEC